MPAVPVIYSTYISHSMQSRKLYGRDRKKGSDSVHSHSDGYTAHTLAAPRRPGRHRDVTPRWARSVYGDIGNPGRRRDALACIAREKVGEDSRRSGGDDHVPCVAALAGGTAPLVRGEALAQNVLTGLKFQKLHRVTQSLPRVDGSPATRNQPPSEFGPPRAFGCVVRASAREGLAAKHARKFCCQGKSGLHAGIARTVESDPKLP